MRHFPLTLPFSSSCSLVVLCTECGLFVFRNHHWIVFLQTCVHSPSQTIYISRATGPFNYFHYIASCSLKSHLPCFFSKSTPYCTFFLEENGLLGLNLYEYPPNCFSSELKSSTQIFLAWELFVILLCFSSFALFLYLSQGICCWINTQLVSEKVCYTRWSEPLWLCLSSSTACALVYHCILHKQYRC